MNKAIEKEDYETATKCRDYLIKLEERENKNG
jgi:protein-arginine kinase activator protein McsA